MEKLCFRRYEVKLRSQFGTDKGVDIKKKRIG
jgi:hypothetical protein